MGGRTCEYCDKQVDTEKVYYKKTEDTYFDRCVECGEPVSAKDTFIKQLMLDIKANEQRSNLVIGAGITIFLIISVIREFF